MPSGMEIIMTSAQLSRPAQSALAPQSQETLSPPPLLNVYCGSYRRSSCGRNVTGRRGSEGRAARLLAPSARSRLVTRLPCRTCPGAAPWEGVGFTSRLRFTRSRRRPQPSLNLTSSRILSGGGEKKSPLPDCSNTSAVFNKDKQRRFLCLLF